MGEPVPGRRRGHVLPARARLAHGADRLLSGLHGVDGGPNQRCTFRKSRLQEPLCGRAAIQHHRTSSDHIPAPRDPVHPPSSAHVRKHDPGPDQRQRDREELGAPGRNGPATEHSSPTPDPKAVVLTNPSPLAANKLHDQDDPTPPLRNLRTPNQPSRLLDPNGQRGAGRLLRGVGLHPLADLVRPALQPQRRAERLLLGGRLRGRRPRRVRGALV